MTDVKSALVAASAVAEQESALDELTAQAQEHDMGYGIDEFKLAEDKISIAREEDTIRRLLERVAEALEPFDKACAEMKKMLRDGDPEIFGVYSDDLCRARSVLADVRKALETMK